MGRYEAGVRSDGGSFAFPIDTGLASRLEGLGLLNASSLVNSCNAGKESVLYNLIPTPVQSLDRFAVTRSTVKWVLGANGLLQEIPANTPAFEYNTDGTYRGLLVEPAGTNLLTYSAQFDDASWTKTDITITPDNTTSPDGTVNADLMTQGTAGTGIIQKNYTVSSGATATESIYVKSIDVPWLRLRLLNGANVTDAWFDIQNGVVGSTAVTGTAVNNGLSIQALPNGWYRCSITGSIPSVTTYAFQILFVTANSGATRVANGQCYLYGAQAETGSVATSYIPTVASTQTRTADSVTLTGASSLIGQQEGTIYFELDFTAGSALIKDAIYLRNSTSTDFVRIVTAVSNAIVVGTRRAGSSNNLITSAAQTSGVKKVAFAYSEADYALYINGVQAGTSTTATVLPSVTMTEVILGNAVINNHLNDRIRSVALFPTRIPNATLAALTA